jgi:hypothetical protein
MKVVFIDTPRPSSLSYSMCSDFPYDLLRETKTIVVHADFNTKTRVSTSVNIGNHRSSVNIPIEGFNTHLKRGYSFLNGQYEDKNFFVKSKQQGLEQYKLYVTEVLEYFFGTYVDELKVSLVTDGVF